VTTAEDLARTDSETATLAALRDAAGEIGGPMERHGLRVFLIADRLATAREEKVDRAAIMRAAGVPVGFLMRRTAASGPKLLRMKNSR
jgi:hypothetical protein